MCEACSQACPKNCIEMVPDAEGYLYPKIDEDTCINCHICENVCPYLNNTFEGNEQRKPIKAYAAYNRDSSIVKKVHQEEFSMSLPKLQSSVAELCLVLS